jgi:hypothetical protein
MGLNGEAFLAWTGQMIQNKDKTSEHGGRGGEIELPVEGDAEATMQTSPAVTYPQGRKPWWWWLLGMPIWVAIASSGAHGSKTFLENLGEDVSQPVHHSQTHEDDTIIGPRRGDFCVAIVFIIFGVIAAVFGVISNFYQITSNAINYP